MSEYLFIALCSSLSFIVIITYHFFEQKKELKTKYQEIKCLNDQIHSLEEESISRHLELENYKQKTKFRDTVSEQAVNIAYDLKKHGFTFMRIDPDNVLIEHK